MIGLLSIPTWIVHLGSVLEWATAMLLFWLAGRKLNNVWLKRMPLAMIPFMLSGWCAIIYHISYDQWDWINQIQAYLTFTGSCCFALWAFLFFRSLTAKLEKKTSRSVRPVNKEVRHG